jgi:hypothetical protein
MHFDFNNQFIKAWELYQYFKKYQKNYFVSFSIEITNLYVKHIPDIKKIVLLCIDIRTVRFFYPIR